MSLVGKLMSELHINAPAEKFYKVFRHNCCHVPNITPKFIQQVEIHDDHWDNHDHGSIKTWYYTLDGKAEVFKEKVEFHDDKYTMNLIGLEGHVFDHYKSYKSSFQVVPKGPDDCLAVLTVEYEKLDDGSPYPYKYLDMLIGVTKDVECHLNELFNVISE